MEGNVVDVTETNLKVYFKPRSRKIRHYPGLLPRVGTGGAHSLTDIRLGACVQPAWLVGTHPSSRPIPLVPRLCTVFCAVTAFCPYSMVL